MTRTGSSEKSDLKCRIIGKIWKKVDRVHAPYGVNKTHMEQVAYGTHAR
jgi:hypothetical protein